MLQVLVLFWLKYHYTGVALTTGYSSHLVTVKEEKTRAWSRVFITLGLGFYSPSKGRRIRDNVAW